jgi:uncharacterized repeat protein (TIGR04138 family)
MEKLNFSDALDQILQEDKRYDRDAYQFVREGLDFTLKMLKKTAHGSNRHVSGPELLEGLRRYALDQFGPMAKTVLDYWGVRECSDFGELVFNMVEKGILGKSEQDQRGDFKAGYDFEEAFVKPYLPATPVSTRRRKSDKADKTNRYRSQNARSSSSGSQKLNSGSN